jgi:hypothetical protein
VESAPYHRLSRYVDFKVVGYVRSVGCVEMCGANIQVRVVCRATRERCPSNGGPQVLAREDHLDVGPFLF